MQKVIFSSKGQESCPQIPVPIPLPSSKGSREPCTDFPWSRHLCQNCSYSSPVCSVLAPKLGQESSSCQTLTPFYCNPALLKQCHRGHVTAEGSVRLCFPMSREQSSPELAMPEMPTMFQRSLLLTKHPLTLRSTSCACKAIT